MKPNPPPQNDVDTVMHIDSLAMEISRLQSENLHLDTDNKVLAEKFQKLTEYNQSLGNELANLDAEIFIINEQIDERSNKLTRLTHQSAKLRKSIKRAKHDLRNNPEFTASINELKARRNQRDQLKNSLRTIQSIDGNPESISVFDALELLTDKVELIDKSNQSLAKELEILEYLSDPKLTDQEKQKIILQALEEKENEVNALREQVNLLKESNSNESNINQNNTIDCLLQINESESTEVDALSSDPPDVDNITKPASSECHNSDENLPEKASEGEIIKGFVDAQNSNSITNDVILSNHNSSPNDQSPNCPTQEEAENSKISPSINIDEEHGNNQLQENSKSSSNAQNKGHQDSSTSGRSNESTISPIREGFDNSTCDSASSNHNITSSEESNLTKDQTSKAKLVTLKIVPPTSKGSADSSSRAPRNKVQQLSEDPQPPKKKKVNPAQAVKDTELAEQLEQLHEELGRKMKERDYLHEQLLVKQSGKAREFSDYQTGKVEQGVLTVLTSSDIDHQIEKLNRQRKDAMKAKELQKDIDEIQETIRSKNDELDTLKKENQNKEKQIAKVKADLAVARSHINKDEGESAKIAQELKRIQAHNQSAEARLYELMKQREQLEGQLNDMEHREKPEVARLAAEVDNYSTKVSEAKEKLEKAEADLKVKREELQEVRNSTRFDRYRDIMVRKAKLERRLNKWKVVTRESSQTLQAIEAFSAMNSQKRASMVNTLEKLEYEKITREEELVQLEEYSDLLSALIQEYNTNWKQ